MAVTDFKKNPDQILVDLINDSNGTLLSVSDITFGSPVAIVNTSRNTAITIAATPTSRYTGTRDLTYNRVLVSQVTEDFDETFAIDGLTSIYQLLPGMNNAYQVNFTAGDVFDGPLPLLTPDVFSEGTFLFKAKPDSLVYRGEAQVKYVAGLPNNLNAFHHFLHVTLPMETFA